ncbi:MAG: EF-hand domain-containing protein [Flavobacteriaceae bacterium]
MKTKSIKLELLSLVCILLVSAHAIGQESDRKREDRKPPSIAKIFKDLDVNKDGKISFKEVKGPLKKDFKKVDANKDGFITREELKKAPKPERKGPPKREN